MRTDVRFLVAALLLAACEVSVEGEPSGSHKEIAPRATYTSAVEIATTVERAEPDASCKDTQGLPGFIKMRGARDVQQCELDGRSATIYLMETSRRVPPLKETDNPPYSWWVVGDRWFIATVDGNLAEQLQEAVGGEIRTNAP